MKNVRITEEQRRTLNAACGDLSKGILWHGFRLTKDDWRHLLSGTALGWRTLPGIDQGDGRAAGLIMLGGSSLKLSKDQASLALTMAFAIGDHPEGQGLKQDRIQWSDTVLLARKELK